MHEFTNIINEEAHMKGGGRTKGVLVKTKAKKEETRGEVGERKEEIILLAK